MSIDRVATNAQTQYLLAQITHANKALDVSQAQVSSGKLADDYAGVGDRAAALEVARAANARSDAYLSNTQLALTQTDLQDNQLTTLSGLASQLQKAIQTAVGNSDGSSLMETAQSIFQQASAILNSVDANGNYIYGGEKTDTPPFAAPDLKTLSTVGNVSDYFVNGHIIKTVQVGDGQTQKMGVLADNIGTQLMQGLKDLYTADGPYPPGGSLTGKLTAAQVDNMTANVLPDATKAASQLTTATAANGDSYKSLKDAITNQQSVSNMYQGFVSDIEDVDMAKALTNLNANQVALQAALSVTARLGQLSLLNYLPVTSG
jgi:flagellar hook-associated protein 3 FlgL